MLLYLRHLTHWPSIIFSSGDHEPLFCVEPDEELDVSVDEICSDSESRASAISDASLASTGIISSISNHGSPDTPNNELMGSSLQNDIADQGENFHATFHTELADLQNDAECQLDSKISLLSVEDEQEGELLSSSCSLCSRHFHWLFCMFQA